MVQNRVASRRTRWALVMGGLMIGASVASADPLDFLAANVQPSPLFDVDAGAAGEWTMPGAFTTFFDGTATAGANLFFIDPSGFTSLMVYRPTGRFTMKACCISAGGTT